MDNRELAIRRNEVHLMLSDVSNRLKYAHRDERLAPNVFGTAKAKAVIAELHSLKVRLYLRLNELKEESGWRLERNDS